MQLRHMRLMLYCPGSGEISNYITLRSLQDRTATRNDGYIALMLLSQHDVLNDTKISEFAAMQSW